MLTDEQEKQVQAMGAKIMAKLRQECARLGPNGCGSVVFKVNFWKAQPTGAEVTLSERLE